MHDRNANKNRQTLKEEPTVKGEKGYKHSTNENRCVIVRFSSCSSKYNNGANKSTTAQGEEENGGRESKRKSD